MCVHVLVQTQVFMKERDTEITHKGHVGNSEEEKKVKEIHKLQSMRKGYTKLAFECILLSVSQAFSLPKYSQIH